MGIVPDLLEAAAARGGSTWIVLDGTLDGAWTGPLETLMEFGAVVGPGGERAAVREGCHVIVEVRSGPGARLVS